MPYTIFEICPLISFDRGIGTRRLRIRVIRIPNHGSKSEELVVLHALTCEIRAQCFARKDVGKEFVLGAGSIRWASGPCIHSIGNVRVQSGLGLRWLLVHDSVKFTQK
jgi:hypothetical protein